jgi:uncharacterized protein YdeI (YjbR/CyaY-like superfamily)
MEHARLHRERENPADHRSLQSAHGAEFLARSGARIQSFVSRRDGQFGTIRSVEELPSDDEFDRLIREAADLAANAPAPRKVKHGPKPPAELHPDFAAALDRTPTAKANLEAFPPGARREYLEWIAEAKQDMTRQKRIADAIEWLSKGKRRNWKYENC